MTGVWEQDYIYPPDQWCIIDHSSPTNHLVDHCYLPTPSITAVQTSGRLPEITEDYWQLLEITEDYWRLLKITDKYWRLLKITGALSLLEITANNLSLLRGYTNSCWDLLWEMQNFLGVLSKTTTCGKQLLNSKQSPGAHVNRFSLQCIITQEWPINSHVKIGQSTCTKYKLWCRELQLAI